MLPFRLDRSDFPRQPGIFRDCEAFE